MSYCNGNINNLNIKTKIPKIIICDTKIKRNTKDMVKKVSLFNDKHPKIAANIFDAIENITIEAKRTLINKTSRSEDELFQDFNELAKINQSLLDCLGVSNEKINTVVNVLREYGMNTKITGAGGGGCTISFVDPQLNDKELADIMKTIEQKTSCKPFVCEISCEGLKCHKGNEAFEYLPDDIRFDTTL